MGVAEGACLGAAQEHQALAVEEDRNGVPCLGLHSCVQEWQSEAVVEDWHQPGVVAEALCRSVGRPFEG